MMERLATRLAKRALALVIVLSAAAGAAQAAEINAFVSTAIKAATDELLPPFEHRCGHGRADAPAFIAQEG